MKRKYRYALRNQDKIRSAFGNEYFEKHIKASLDALFSTPFCLYDVQENSRWATDLSYPVILINDVADEDDMQLFACISQDFKYDVVRLAYVERIKG